MAYATLEHLIDRHGEGQLVLLTDHGAVATGVVDADVVARALADTDALIDGFLQDRYTLPLAVVPPLLTDIAIAVGIWKLHRSTPDDKVKDDYRDALAMLERIGKGIVKLSVGGVEAATNGNAGIRITDRERPLTAENMTGFI